MKTLEFGIEKDGQPYLRVRHGADRKGKCGASKTEFQSMKLFKALPSDYIEKCIAELWRRPGVGNFVGCDLQGYD